MERDEKLSRMLLWFEAQLPAHELGYWEITSQPVPAVIENEDPPGVHRMRESSGWRVRGRAQCVRCGKTFTVPDIGNFTAATEDRIPRIAQDAKAWVARDAERGGPCWGEIPKETPQPKWFGC